MHAEWVRFGLFSLPIALFRSWSGRWLWPFVSGRVRLPAQRHEAMFVPQLPYIPLGATTPYVAYSTSLTGVFPAPVAAYWNIGKQA